MHTLPSEMPAEELSADYVVPEVPQKLFKTYTSFEDGESDRAA